MVVRVYVSGISGNKEVKKRQQRVTMILDSKSIKYNVIDIAEPGKESEKEFMQEKGKARDSKHPLPPQIFNDDNYCGDYDDFDMANELDELEKFLSISANNENTVIVENGISNGSSKEHEKDESFVIKEDVRESKEEDIEVDEEDTKEAVLLDNAEIESAPDPIPDPIEPLQDEVINETIDEPQCSEPIGEPQSSEHVDEPQNSEPIDEPHSSEPIDEPHSSEPIDESHSSEPSDSEHESVENENNDDIKEDEPDEPIEDTAIEE